MIAKGVLEVMLVARISNISSMLLEACHDRSMEFQVTAMII